MRIPEPVNMTDKYLYSIAVNLLEINSSLKNIEAKMCEEEMKAVLSSFDDVAVEEHTVERITSVDVEDYNEDPINLESKTVVELKDIAKEMGITGFSNMKKGELIEVLLRGE